MEEEEEEEDIGLRCPMMGRPNLGEGVESSSRGRNRNARVVDGHVYFHTSSLNGDTCPLSPDLDTCKLVVSHCLTSMDYMYILYTHYIVTVL